MMRALSIVAIVFTIVFLAGCIYFSKQARIARFEYVLHDYSYDSYDSYSSYSAMTSDYYLDAAHDATRKGAIFSLAMLLIFEAVFVLSLLKVKTKTMKVLSIIGMALNGLMITWSFVPVVNPGAVSFDEVGAAFILYALVPLAFFIVGTIHSFRVNA